MTEDELRTWTLELPFSKPMSLNDRANPWAKAKITKEWVDATIWLCRAAKIPKLTRRITVVLYYEPADRRTRDPLNLVQSLKAIEDGVVRAKLIPDDNPDYLVSSMPVVKPKGPGHGTGRFWAVISEL